MFYINHNTRKGQRQKNSTNHCLSPQKDSSKKKRSFNDGRRNKSLSKKKQQLHQQKIQEKTNNPRRLNSKNKTNTSVWSETWRKSKRGKDQEEKTTKKKKQAERVSSHSVSATPTENEIIPKSKSLPPGYPPPLLHWFFFYTRPHPLFPNPTQPVKLFPWTERKHGR